MKALKSLFVLLTGCMILVSCEKEEKLNPADVDNIPGLGGDTWTQTPVDKWILDNLTSPYNISVKYKWDQSELEFDKTLVPPREDQIVPVMDAIKKGWITPYISETGELFFKKFTPKFFSLVGSGSYNLDGSVTLGTAEGGRKVVLYQTNYVRTKEMPGFVQSDSFLIKQMFHTIHHEFGHILHQNILYPPEFKRIGQSLYTSDWINTNDFEANTNGFVTAYAMSGPDDDFVEMISIMLIEGKAGFDEIVNSIPPGTSALGTTQAEAIKNLRDKESLVVNYYKQVWNIDFYSLQAKTRAAIAALIY
jgi:substrate import-associated zinc metallohydrolase lipoprotein